MHRERGDVAPPGRERNRVSLLQDSGDPVVSRCRVDVAGREVRTVARRSTKVVRLAVSARVGSVRAKVPRQPADRLGALPSPPKAVSGGGGASCTSHRNDAAGQGPVVGAECERLAQHVHRIAAGIAAASPANSPSLRDAAQRRLLPAEVVAAA